MSLGIKYDIVLLPLRHLADADFRFYQPGERGHSRSPGPWKNDQTSAPSSSPKETKTKQSQPRHG
jgi:hypothetical protein